MQVATLTGFACPNCGNRSKLYEESNLDCPKDNACIKRDLKAGGFKFTKIDEHALYGCRACGAEDFLFWELEDSQ
jgi:predicted  nucleic acid-binding Zn-ribbon protein